jgi:8-oxo-dGTP pyrophosphatase MutT (NUDIX family)
VDWVDSREVEEETGLRVQLGKYIDSVNYWVTNHPDYPGQQLRKTVYYYLMEPIGGDFSRHDGEFDTVDWVDSREVEEETGLRVQLGKYIDSVNYWVTNHPDYPGQQLRKTVYYYLMEPIGGDFSRHDGEFDTVDWVDSRDISNTLSFENEVKIVQKGISLVKGRK